MGKVCTNPECDKAGMIQPFSAFARASKMKDGHKSRCKDCLNAQKRKYHSENSDAISARAKSIRENDPYRLLKDAKYRERNREGIRGANKRWAEKNGDALTANRRRFKESDPDYFRRRYADNRDEIRAKANAYNSTEHAKEVRRRRRRMRYREDPRFALDCNISSAINMSLAGRKAGRSWESLVGYSLDELMVHLEGLFEDGMTWDNRGRLDRDGWEVDHIVPRCAFEFDGADDVAFRECWSLENLRPMWGLDNRAKGGKHLQENEQCQVRMC